MICPGLTGSLVMGWSSWKAILSGLSVAVLYEVDERINVERYGFQNLPLESDGKFPVSRDLTVGLRVGMRILLQGFVAEKICGRSDRVVFRRVKCMRGCSRPVLALPVL